MIGPHGLGHGGRACVKERASLGRRSILRGRPLTYHRLEGSYFLRGHLKEEGGVVEGLKLGTCPHNIAHRGAILGCLSVSETAITTRYLWAIAFFLGPHSSQPARYHGHSAKHAKVFVFALWRRLYCRVVSVASAASVGGKRV
jgi:hypothetical protein